MQIQFSPEAGDAYNSAVAGMAGWCVEITLDVDDEPWERQKLKGDEPAMFTATLIGPDYDADWYGTVKVRRWLDDSGDVLADEESVIAKRIYVN